MSIHPYVCRPFVIFVFVLIFSVGVQHRDSFVNTMGSKGPQWCPVEHICLSISLSLCLYVSIFGLPHCFLAIICATHNCAQRMRPQATGSNPLSGSIICPSVCPSILPWDFCGFCICINFHCGGPALQCIYPES